MFYFRTIHCKRVWRAGPVRYSKSSWNVRFAKKGVNKELRYLSKAATSGSCALPALLSCGPGSFITAKRVKNTDLVGLGKKTGYWMAAGWAFTGCRRARYSSELAQRAWFRVVFLFGEGKKNAGCLVPRSVPRSGENPAVKKSQHQYPLIFFYAAPPFSGLARPVWRILRLKKHNTF